ncbi:MAG: LysR family transcriptional regulator [Beijerinckiaceae bacterium]
MDRYGEMLVFVRAVEDGGFSAAGRSLSLTPSAVSKLVTRMENRLGVLLFRRSHRTVALTPEGEAFYAAARRAIEAVEEAESTVMSGRATRDTLRIRSMPTFAISQLAPLIPAFCRLHPSLRLEFHLKIEPGNLLDGGIDVAIHVGELADSSLVAHRFARTRWIICAAPSYLAEHGAPRGPADLVHHECLNFIPSMSASSWTVKAAGSASRRVKIKSSIVTNQGQMLLELARAGVGITRLAEFHVLDDLVAGRLVELFPDQQNAEEDPIYAVYQRKRHLSQRVRVFLDFLDSCFLSDNEPAWQRRDAGKRSEAVRARA